MPPYNTVMVINVSELPLLGNVSMFVQPFPEEDIGTESFDPLYEQMGVAVKSRFYNLLFAF